MQDIAHYAHFLSKETGIEYQYIRNTLTLLSEGATIPFIARYRKEKTNSMDETVIASIQKRWQQLEALDKRREAIRQSIEEQGALTAALSEQIEKASTMQELEDLYLPYKPKRRTRATIARERGLEPLAQLLLRQDHGDPEEEARPFVQAEKGVPDTEAAIEGARDILAEMVNEDVRVRERLRLLYQRTATIASTVAKDKEDEGKTYRQYFDWSEPLTKAPSHRVLALLRAEAEGILKLKISVDEEKAVEMASRYWVRNTTAKARQVSLAVHDAFAVCSRPR